MITDLTNGNTFFLAGSVSNTAGISSGNTGQSITTATTTASAQSWDYGGQKMGGGELTHYAEVMLTTPAGGTLPTLQVVLQDTYDAQFPPQFSPLRIYQVGEYVTFNGLIYLCSTLTTVGQSPATTPASWTAGVAQNPAPGLVSASWRDLVMTRIFKLKADDADLNVAGAPLVTIAIPPSARRWFRMNFITTGTSPTFSILAYIKPFN
jgi:hypothetical protein